MNNTQKALINQDVCEQTTPNLGITQSSGLDHHAVYSRQRVDDFRENGVVSTQSARQHKDATDLVCQKAEAYVKRYLSRRWNQKTAHELSQSAFTRSAFSYQSAK